MFETFRNGFLIVFLNPKIAAFFLAIFSQFLNAASNLESKFIMVATASVVDGLWYILLTFVIAVPKFTNFVKVSEKKIEFLATAFDNKSLNNIKKCLELYSSKESNHKCANCGFSSIRHFWQCPSCHQWSSINKSTLAKSKNDHYVV